MQNRTIRNLSMAAITALVAISGASNSVCAEQIEVPAGEVKDTIDINSDSKDIKSAVNVKGTAENINAQISNGTLNILSTDDYNYSTILSEANGVINNLNAVFDTANINIQNKEVSGALIKSIGEITNIDAKINNITLASNSSLTGALVSIESSGKISEITGEGFKNNTIETTSNADITGSIIANHGELGSIKETEFSENTVNSESGNIHGGALANEGHITGNIENVIFKNNKITTSSGLASGGAIYNTGVIEGILKNVTFNGNTATSQTGTAHGGAIYTTGDITIVADNGKSLFQGNTVTDINGTRNEAIYVDSRVGKLTLNAINNGQILIYDDIDGFEGYSLTLQGDESSKIGIFGNVTNANVTVNGGNIDFINDKTTDFNFGQFLSENASSKYSIDIDLNAGKADNFTLAAGSKGTMFIDEVNFLNGMSDESVDIKILNILNPNSVGIELSDTIKSAINKTETEHVEWIDNITAEISWGDTINVNKRDDIVKTTIDAIASVNGGLKDTIRYTVDRTEGIVTTEVAGDTLGILNRVDSERARTFKANVDRNLYTVSEDLGSTGLGELNIVGVHDADQHEISSKLDANGHSLFNVDKASTLNLSDIQISNAKNEVGSVLNITNSDAVVNLSNVLIDNTNGATAIHNDGTINYSIDGATTNTLPTAIEGDGVFNLSGGRLDLIGQSSISQSVINITNGGWLWALTNYNTRLNGQINVDKASEIRIFAENIGGNINNDGFVLINGGVLDYEISGNGRTHIERTVTANKHIATNIIMGWNSTLNISADNIGGKVNQTALKKDNASTLNLSTGTLKHDITGQVSYVNIIGDVISEALIDSIVNIDADSSLTINASDLGNTNIYPGTNDGDLWLTGGTLNRTMNGTGTTHIIGDTQISLSGTSKLTQSNIIIENIENKVGTLTTNASKIGGKVTNNNVLNLTGGILSHEVSGEGKTNVTGAVESAKAISTETNVTDTGKLTISASNIQNTITNDGILTLNGGTLSQEINGKGSTHFFAETIVSTAINQEMVIDKGIKITFNDASYIGGDMSGSNAHIYILGGTLSHKLYSSYVDIGDDSKGVNVTLDENGFMQNYIYVRKNSTLTMKASQTTHVGSFQLLEGSILNLDDGAFRKTIMGSGTVNIVGDVLFNGTGTLTGKNFNISKDGTFTCDMTPFLFQNITNEGTFKISGELDRNIAGSGVTQINGDFIMKDDAAIEGTLDFNNKTLDIADSEINNFNIGKLTGDGTFKFDIDVTNDVSDTLTLSQESNANILADFTLTNVNNTFSDKIFEVLKGATGTTLNIKNGTYKAPIVNRTEAFIEDFETPEIVHFNDAKDYKIVDEIGEGTVDVSVIDNNKLSLSLNDITWTSHKEQTKDLFYDWTQYKTTNDKSFIFDSATDVYNISEFDYNTTITNQTYNITGVRDGDNVSTLNFKIDNNRSHIDFQIGNGGVLNLSDIGITGIKVGSSIQRFVLVDKNGKLNLNNIVYEDSDINTSFHNNGTIENITGTFNNNVGGTLIFNTNLIKNISGSFTNNNSWSSRIQNYNTTSKIESIHDSLFEGNCYSSSNTVMTPININNKGIIDNLSNNTFKNNYARIYNTGIVRGLGIYNEGTINNFDGNIFESNDTRNYNNNSYVDASTQGGAFYNTGTITNGILNSQFINNKMIGNAENSKGTALYNTGTIKVIDNTKFIGNVFNPAGEGSAQGGAIFNAGTITEGIKNSLFQDNLIEILDKDLNSNQNIYGGTIYNAKALTITDTDFINNQIIGKNVYAQGGAIKTTSKLTILRGLFEGNRIIAGTNFGGAIALSGDNSSIEDTIFRNNSAQYGGAIFISGINSFIKANFENNTAKTQGGALHLESTNNVNIQSSFIGNTANSGGAIDNAYSSRNTQVSNSTFTNNSALNDGGAILNSPSNGGTYGFSLIADSTFTGNHAGRYGGAIYNSTISYIKEINNVVFDGNYVNGSIGRGGAIYDILASNSAENQGIINSSFTNNYVIGTSSAQGGAIYSNGNLWIRANNNGESKFSGNYVQVGNGEKDYQAIYAQNNTNHIILQADSNGTITFDDNINGALGYYTDIKGDGTGTLNLFNNINNSQITAQNIHINTSNNKIFNYDFYKLTSNDSAKYTIDVDLTNGEADNFTLGYASTGKITLEDINFLGELTENKRIQIIKNNRSDVQLALDKATYGDYNVVENIFETVSDTVYSNQNFEQEKGLILTTTDSLHDSLEFVAENTQYDGLSLVASKESANPRNFIFEQDENDTSSYVTYNLHKDMADVAGGTLNIKGLADKTSTINADGHKLFNLVKETQLNLTDVTLTGADELITVHNAYTVLNLDNTNIHGNITGQTGFNINLKGNNNIQGVVTNATTTINDGNLKFSQNAFSGNGTTLIINGGVINFQNDSAETYEINNLASNANAQYKIDLDLNTLTADKLVVKDSNATGTVTITDINTFGNLTIDKVGKYQIKVLDTTSSDLKLALSDAVAGTKFNLGAIREDNVKDTIAQVTYFDTKYYEYYREGIIEGKLSIDPDNPGSITLDAQELWNAPQETELLGDTMQLVAKADLEVRKLEARKSTDTYNVQNDIGTVAKGELVISGVSDENGKSTVNLANHQGFVLGKDTTLSIHNAKITNSDTPIEIIEQGASVQLENADLSGGIKSDVNYNLSLIGNGTTTVNGTLTNANATLSQGGFIFNSDTFAGANTSFRADGGTVYMNDNATLDYTFNNLVSSTNARYAINVDMANNKADTFNVLSGSGVITIDSLELIGLTPVLNENYTIKILNNNGNNITLALSDVLKSQQSTGDFKLGSSVTTRYDSVEANTLSSHIYQKSDDVDDVYGVFDLNDAKDSLILQATKVETVAKGALSKWDDTLKLWNQLKTEQDRNFNIDKAAGNSYTVEADLGTTTAGNLAVNGNIVNDELSTINANEKTLFELANDSSLTISNVKITNGRASTGSILNITNSNAQATLNNVVIDSVGNNVDGIFNVGTLTFDGAENAINTNIAGSSGILNIDNGAKLTLGENNNITQSQVNVINGSLDLASTDVIFAALNISTNGNASMSANAIRQNVSNDGNLTLSTGNLAFEINGKGSTNIIGAVKSISAITQDINISKDGSLSISVENLGASVANANELTLTGTGELSQLITGVGSTTIDGNIESSVKISQDIQISENGALTISAENIGGSVTNAKDLNLTGGILTQNITGSGRTNISQNTEIQSTIVNNTIHLNSGVLKLAENSDISGATLNVHSGSLDLTDGKVGTRNLGNVILSDDLHVTIDADLSSKTADLLSAVTLENDNNHSIIIDSIKVVTDNTQDALPFEVQIANDVLASAVKLATDVISVSGNKEGANYLVSYSKDTGKLKFEYGNLTSAILLTSGDRQYSLQADETSDLGVENGANSTLTVIGNNHAINVNSGKNWTIGEDRTVNLTNLGKAEIQLDSNGNVILDENGNADVTITNNGFNGADTTAIVVNGGNLNVENSVFTNNSKTIISSSNNGTLNAESLVVYQNNADNSLISSNNSHIKKIDGQFINNTVNITNSNGSTSAMIYLTASDIDTISGNFVNNATIASSDAKGGTIQSEASTVDKLIGNFTANSAQTKTGSALGGAIYNAGTIQSVASSIFSGNFAQSTSGTALGGAIYNTGTIGFSGTNTFTNNFTQVGNTKTANDIYNAGTINLAQDSILNINSGINGSNGKINLASGSKLNLNATINANTVNLNGASINISENGLLDLTGLTTGAQGGSVNTQNNVINNNKLGAVTLTGALNTAIDIDITNKTADTFTSSAANNGVVNITDINILDGAFANITDKNFKIQILDTQNNGLQLSLSDEVKAQLGGDTVHRLGKTGTHNSSDAVTKNTNWKDAFYDRTYDDYLTGIIGVTTSSTTNDSIGVTNAGTESVQTDATKRGDTLALVNQSTIADRTFDFDGTGQTYNAVGNLGSTGAGGFSVNGFEGGSTINLANTYTGFNVIQNSVLNLNNITISGAKGSDIISSGTVNLYNTTLGTVENSNILNLTGNNIIQTITKTGTTNINSGSTKVADLNQNILNILANANLAISNNALISTLDNKGSLNAKTATITSGTNASTGSINASESIIFENGFTNEGTIVTKDGENKKSITGGGTLEISGNFTNNGTISQSSLTNSGTLNSSGNITAAVTNSGTINNTSTITGAITNTQSGNITSLANNLIGNVANAGTLNIQGGTTQGNITGSGTTNVSGSFVVNHTIKDNTLVLNSGSNTTITNGSLSLGGLTAKGGSLNSQNAKTDTLNLGNVVLNSDLILSIDADLKAQTADTIHGTSITTNGHSIIVNSINALTDATINEKLEISFADSVLKDSVKLSADSIVVSGAKANTSYLVTYSTISGNLIFTYGDLNSAVHTSGQRNYTLAKDESISKDLLTMEDKNDVLTINGNGHNIIGNKHEGITVSNKNTLNVNNVNSMHGFTTALNNKTDGTINVSNSNFTGNQTDIANAGALNFAGVNSLDTITGVGTTTLTDGQTTINTTLSQNKVIIDETAKLINAGNAVIGNLANAGTISNNSQNLTIKGGSNSNIIDGTGKTTIDGNFTNSGKITQGTVAVNTGKTLTNTNEITASIDNKGTIKNNSEKLTIKGGSNSNTIEGTGKTTVDGDFTNSGKITQDTVTVNADKTLTNTNEISAIINNLGTIDNNSEKLTINGGSNSNIIKGTGKTTINGDFTNSGKITQGTVAINTGKTLTNNNEIKANINNSGIIDNTSTITGAITNTASGIINSSASSLVGNIANSGTLNFAGGQTQGNITGTNGTININKDLTISHNISGNTLVLNNNTTTTINNGSLVLNGLEANGGALNAQNDKRDTINLGNVVLNSDMNFSVDADLQNKWADSLSADSVSGEHNIIIDSIHILTDSSDRIPISLNVANDTLKDHVKLDDNFNVTTANGVKDSYLISYESKDGTLTFEYLTLSVAVKSQTEQKVYVMSEDEIITSDLGQLNGKSLSINGNGGTIQGSGNVNGINVGSGKTLSLNNLTYTGFNTAVDNQNGGTVNVKDTKFENNQTDIINNGTLNFYGEDSVNKIEGSDGVLNINSYKDESGKVVNANVTINENGSVQQKEVNIQANNKLVNNGTLIADTIANHGTLENNTQLNISTATNSGEIVGLGNIDINGKLTNTGSINQKNVTVADGAELITSLEKVTTADKQLINKGTLSVTDGVNTLTVTGNGKTEIIGDVINNGTIEQKTVSVAQGGNLTTSLKDIITDDIQISGELNVRDKIIDKNINGTSTGIVNLNQALTLDSTIKGTQVALNNNSTIKFGEKADLSGISNFIVNNGGIDMVNKSAKDIINLGQRLTLSGNLDLAVDVDLANKSMDRISADSVQGNGYVNVKSMNMLSDAKDDTTRVLFADSKLKNNVKTDVKTVSYSPMWKYGVEYDKTRGEFIFTRGGSNSGSNSGNNAFNPAVLGAPVASQISGNITMSQTIGEAFEHSDWFSRLSNAQKFAQIHSNQYAIASTDYNGNMGKIDTGMSNQGFWTRPYSTFESVNLKNGPKVNLISYGTIVGGDSAFKLHQNGWASVTSAYIGYHGSQYNYSGISSTSNGGVLGFTETFYKGNFYTALTATAGANFNETNTMYGKQDIPMLMAGIASKSGYNFEFNDGKFILQPNLLMSYSFIDTLGSNHSAGVKIDNDPLHTIQVAPSLRFIGNLKNGYQPYATVGMVWNIMNNTHAKANGVDLADMSTKPYVEYGVGLQKLWKDNFSAYGQATIRNGGRNGIALTAGFRWALGKDGNNKNIEKVNAKTIKTAKKPATAEPPKKIILKQQTKARIQNTSTTTRADNNAVIKRI